MAARTVVKLDGITDIALTKLDVLDGFDRIKVCTRYRSGKRDVDYFPAETRTIERCRPHYESVDGWERPVAGARADTLSPPAHDYVCALERWVGCRVSTVSVGADRSAIIARGEAGCETGTGAGSGCVA